MSNPGYSGLRERRYDRPHEDVVQTTVRTARLDDEVDADRPIHLVKIDVEGAELQVLQGGERVLSRWRPYIVLEHGLGAADRYGTRPEDVYDLLSGWGLQVSLLHRWLARRPASGPLDRAGFVRQFDQAIHYYFLAHPDR